MKYLILLPLWVLSLSAYAFKPTADFEVIDTKTLRENDSEHGVQFLADVRGAVRVGRDFRPTDDETSPLYKFKTIHYFWQNHERISGYVASIDIVNCQDKSVASGPIWHYLNDDSEPRVIPPTSTAFEAMTQNYVYYPVAQRLCHW